MHRAAVEYYRTLLPESLRYFLGRFSIKKGGNIYGLIFGSGHPRGMDKFLQVAWTADKINGEADFDINRDNFGPLSDLLPRTKVSAFEIELRGRILTGEIKNETDIIDLCFQHGVTRQHAKPVLKHLLDEGLIECEFRVPDVRRFESPKPIRMRGGLRKSRLF